MDGYYDPRYVNVVKIKTLDDAKIIEKELRFKIEQIQKRISICDWDERSRAESAIEECEHKLSLVKERAKIIRANQKADKERHEKKATAEEMANEIADGKLKYIQERVEYLRKFYHAAKEVLSNDMIKKIKERASSMELSYPPVSNTLLSGSSAPDERMKNDMP